MVVSKKMFFVFISKIGDDEPILTSSNDLKPSPSKYTMIYPVVHLCLTIPKIFDHGTSGDCQVWLLSPPIR